MFDCKTVLTITDGVIFVALRLSQQSHFIYVHLGSAYLHSPTSAGIAPRSCPTMFYMIYSWVRLLSAPAALGFLILEHDGVWKTSIITKTLILTGWRCCRVPQLRRWMRLVVCILDVLETRIWRNPHLHQGG